MIYLKSFALYAPFNNDVIQTLSFHWEYWKKYGFRHVNSPENRLNDSIGTYSNYFSTRGSSAKLGDCTLSDFHEQTRPGDTGDVYIFSVISTEKVLVDRTIEDVMRGFESYVNKKNSQEEPYSLSQVTETLFAFDGINCEGLSTNSKMEKWEKLLQDFPYVDIVYRWLLVNRHYPVTSRL